MFQVFTRSFPQVKLFPADDGLYALACEAARARLPIQPGAATRSSGALLSVQLQIFFP